jgi:hypothetical protein
MQWLAPPFGAALAGFPAQVPTEWLRSFVLRGDQGFFVCCADDNVDLNTMWLYRERFVDAAEANPTGA